MKMINKIIALVIVLGLAGNAYSQNLNWVNLNPETKHLVTVNSGWEYGMVFGTGYSYHVKSKMPLLLNASFSIPAGGKLFDDFKTKAGAQVRIYRIQNIHFSASVYGIYRRYENPLVRLQNFGSEMTGVIGFYKPKWFAATEFGFDKAIVTHFKHSSVYKENIYENVKDGWYEPATGGNFNYGIQAGFSLKKIDFTLAGGRVISQDFITTPYLPWYGKIGILLKINDCK